MLYLSAFVCFGMTAAAQGTQRVHPGNGNPWRLSDYGKHDSASFRRHAPALQPVRRGTIDYGLLEAAIFYAANEQRVLHGVAAFRYSEGLRRAARTHSQDMATFGFFSHKNPHDPTRRTPFERMALQGVSGGSWAENIAMTSVGRHTYLSVADEIISLWMKSPGHRRNMLNPRMLYLGCGVHSNQDPHFQILATQDFSSTTDNKKK